MRLLVNDPRAVAGMKRVPVGLGVHVGGAFTECHIDLAGFVAVDLLAEVTSGKSVSVFGVGVDRSHGHECHQNSTCC